MPTNVSNLSKSVLELTPIELGDTLQVRQNLDEVRGLGAEDSACE